MTTLMKRRKRNRLLPLENRLLTPWGNSLFPSSLTNLMRFDDLFEDDSLMPAMNVQEHEKEFEIDFAAPGFNKKDFEVTIEDDILYVSGEKEVNEEEKEDDYSRKEFSYTSFKKSMLLPPSADLNQDVKASYKNGILKIKLLKKEVSIEETPPKKVIEVH
ncbi:Hsp20/alpha crystallin family protein [Thalassobellus suaedae]|uniref:Hsp20/alpha crystallin family protein n=1 Tax=Thalassobellus suaedae TaxID=3074124 RepID=A0ABY9Y358_9FLAO|nr:Hsp20/alpha crystallin family protein [Flavobacteriaceae bacterium HL-DH14]WNH12654.1 Hsp20/alpha crystallin family protein [Flavobacteriaceae bacterium HL-DH10]